jgi:hypothetical protein
LTIIRRLFFRQTIFAWQVFESTIKWQKKYFMDSGETRILNQQTNKKSRFLFYRKKNCSHFFMWDKFFDSNFLTIWEIISDAEKDEDNFFTFLFFVFVRQFESFPVGQKVLIQSKNDESFFTFSWFFSVGQKIFENFFPWTNGICKIEIRLICAFTVWETKRFFPI